MTPAGGIILGAIVGALLALVHLRATWWAAQRAIDTQRGGPAMAFAFVRVFAIATALAATIALGGAATLAALAAFFVTHTLHRKRYLGSRA